ncbi:hypothetical protein [Roseateles chitinivorans]|uniref:hypothetical protein n=1 Tax=Roseateles chitinivorans TaxID=2917965 RepID=UPI003D678694
MVFSLEAAARSGGRHGAAEHDRFPAARRPEFRSRHECSSAVVANGCAVDELLSIFERLLQMQGAIPQRGRRPRDAADRVDTEISNHEKNLPAYKKPACCSAARFLIMEDSFSRSGFCFASH